MFNQSLEASPDPDDDVRWEKSAPHGIAKRDVRNLETPVTSVGLLFTDRDILPDGLTHFVVGRRHVQRFSRPATKQNVPRDLLHARIFVFTLRVLALTIGAHVEARCGERFRDQSRARLVKSEYHDDHEALSHI